MNLRDLMAHPLTRGMEIDAPLTTKLRRRILESKPSLHKIYTHRYTRLAALPPDGPDAVLEAGLGAGFLAEHIPGLIARLIFYCGHVQAVLDRRQLPLASGSLKAIVMSASAGIARVASGVPWKAGRLSSRRAGICLHIPCYAACERRSDWKGR